MRKMAKTNLRFTSQASKGKQRVLGQPKMLTIPSVFKVLKEIAGTKFVGVGVKN